MTLDGENTDSCKLIKYPNLTKTWHILNRAFSDNWTLDCIRKGLDYQLPDQKDISQSIYRQYIVNKALLKIGQNL